MAERIANQRKRQVGEIYKKAREPGFPAVRMRRLRENPLVRRLVSEARLTKRSLIMPYFVKEGLREKALIPSMPGQYQFPVEDLVGEVEHAATLGIEQVILFGIPSEKDARGSGAYDSSGIVQRAIRELKSHCPTVLVIADTCLCEFMSHGHCGIIKEYSWGRDVANDETLDLLARAAVSQAQAGADIVAPSDMMDGRVRAIRQALDEAGFEHVPILSYAAKFASAFYAPFREAAESAPRFGNRRSYQISPSQRREALREVELDLQEGADLIMVKPALSCLDIVREVRDRFDVPLAVFSVSGEYAMLKAAAERGWIDERETVLELATGFVRAGADFIISYHAKDLASWLS